MSRTYRTAYLGQDKWRGLEHIKPTKSTVWDSRPHIGRKHGVRVDGNLHWTHKRQTFGIDREGSVRLGFNDDYGVKGDLHRAMRRGAKVQIQRELEYMDDLIAFPPEDEAWWDELERLMEIEAWEAEQRQRELAYEREMERLNRLQREYWDWVEYEYWAQEDEPMLGGNVWDGEYPDICDDCQATVCEGLCQM